MKSGMLWFDGSKKPIALKIQDAAARYQQKFGVPPNTCFINPIDSLPDVAVTGISISPKVTILRNHVWLGVTNPAPAQPQPQTLYSPILANQ